MRSSFRNKLTSILTRIGYDKQIEDKTDAEVVQLIEENLIDLEEIDLDEPFEIAVYALKHIFENKYYVSIENFINDEDLKKLYLLLVDYKQEQVNLNLTNK